MQCPVDQTVLQMSERSGVEIDYCPTCRGVWLDRGELDKILDRAAAEVSSVRPDPRTESAGYPQQQPYDPGYQQRGYDSRPQQGYDPRQQKRKKRSFLDDLFD
jgi:Zn-finger nucleic acid-binding protein